MDVTHDGSKFDGPEGIYSCDELGAILILSNRQLQMAEHPYKPNSVISF